MRSLQSQDWIITGINSYSIDPVIQLLIIAMALVTPSASPRGLRCFFFRTITNNMVELRKNDGRRISRAWAVNRGEDTYLAFGKSKEKLSLELFMNSVQKHK